MSKSDSDEDIGIPVSKKRKSKIKRVESSNSEDESNSDVPVKKKQSKTPQKSDMKSETPTKNILKTPAARSSDRLRKKKSFSLPSREERLEIISPGVMKSSNKTMRELKPRRQVNNFIRERNSYASEKVGDIYLTDDSLSDFIVDGDDDDEEEEDKSSSDSTTPDDKPIKKRKCARKGKNNSDSDSNNDSRKSKTKRGKKSKRKKQTIASSSDEENLSSPGDSDTPLSTLLDRKRKHNRQTTKNNKRKSTRRKILESSGSENDCNNKETNNDSSDDEEKGNSQPCVTAVRRSSRRKELIEKKDFKNQKFAQLKENRRKSSAKEKTESKKDEKVKCNDDGDNVLQSLIDNYSTDEDDKQFLVSDQEISEEENDSDFEVTFLKLRDSQSTDEDEEILDSSPSKASIKMRRKQQHQASKWKRINTKVESNESEDSDSNNEEYDHGCLLHTAVKKNHIDSVKEILQEDPACVNELGYRKRSALHLAALNGNAEMVQLLLKSKANCKLQDKDGFPPIAYAANGHSECLKVLLKNSDIKKVDKALIQTASKMSLLHLAVGESRTAENCDERGRCMDILFAHDEDACVKMLDHQDARGRALLEAAVFTSQHKCVEVLLKYGANPLSFRTGEDGNVLHFAVESASHLKRVSTDDIDSSLCLKELIEPMKLNLDNKDSHDFTPLMYACESGNDECLLALIEAGATVIAKDSYDTSPLHLAAMAGSTECVQILLQHHHPVDCVDKCGWPPLLYADFNAKEECVLALMKPKPKQLFVLGNLLQRHKTSEDQKKTFKVVKNVLMSLANHDAYYTVFNDFIRVHPELLDEYNHGLLQHTWRAILDFNNKHSWFKRRLNALPGTNCWSLGCSVNVNRSDVLGSAMSQIGQVPAKRLRNDMNVTFANEHGICTGPKREFFVCLCKDVVKTDRGLFVETDDCQYSPVPNTYFSTFPTEVSNPAPSPPEETKKVVKEELDFSDIIIEDITDSELMAVDLDNSVTHDSVTASFTADGDAVTDSGISTTNMASQVVQSQSSSTSTSTVTSSDTARGLEGAATDQFSSSNIDAASSSQETSSDNINQNSQSDENTWISCSGKKYILIPSIMLRSKMKQLSFIGRLVGSAICQDMLLNFHLSKPFVKQVLGIPLSLPDDLASFDHLLHEKMVVWVLENSVDELDLPFSLDVINPWTEKLVTVNLTDDGDKTLNDSNKDEYVKLVSQFKLETFIKKEVDAFKMGLNEVIPSDLLSFFTADEFSLLLNGVTKIDVDDWKQNTNCSGFKEFPHIITWFWDIVSKLKEEEKALLMQFSTGSPCVPVGGFANLRGYSGTNKFTLSKHLGLNKIPQASTCFNILQLTDYDSEKELREKLLIAIRHGSEGFSFS